MKSESDRLITSGRDYGESLFRVVSLLDFILAIPSLERVELCEVSLRAISHSPHFQQLDIEFTLFARPSRCWKTWTNSSEG